MKDLIIVRMQMPNQINYDGLNAVNCILIAVVE